MAEATEAPFPDAAPDNDCFVEIHKISMERDSTESSFLDAYVATVDPPMCGTVVKRLAVELPLRSDLGSDSFDLTHLKRVKRIQFVDEKPQSEKSHVPQMDNSLDSRDGTKPSPTRSTKRPRCPVQLQVLLGPVDFVERMLLSTNGGRRDSLSEVVKKKYDLVGLLTAPVPIRTPESQVEWKAFQQVWPTTYFPNKTSEHREKALCLEDHETKSMQQGMREALLDAAKWNGSVSKPVGTVVVDPQSGIVVARSSEEYLLQGIGELDQTNPLQSSVIFAIQAVSRLERQAALLQGMESSSFQGGQYLCTGFDVYTTLEPPVFEAMALVHARIRRLVFGCSDVSNGTLGGLRHYNVHSLPGTNHKYRAFMCNEHSGLWRACRSLLTT